jgi:hypothetical protein
LLPSLSPRYFKEAEQGEVVEEKVEVENKEGE